MARTKKVQLDAATQAYLQERGRMAWDKGIHAPCLCSEWMKAIEGMKVGDPKFNAVTDAWKKGWDAARNEEIEVKMKELFPELYA